MKVPGRLPDRADRASRLKRGRLLAGALALAALATVGASTSRAGPGQAPRATCGKLLPPSWGAYLGAFPDFNTTKVYSEDHVREARIADFEQLAGRPLSWVYFSQHWYLGLAFPRERVLTIWRHGAVPYIAFLPSSGTFYGPGKRQRNPERRYTLQRIIDGVFDPQLRAWAAAARDLNVPVLVSFGAEVNDEWGPWSARWNGAGETDGYGDPAYPDGAERYRDAFRHIVALTRAEGATNLTWFFHADSYRPYTAWNRLELYYPGDGYVDWLGISDYGSLDARVPISPFARKIDVSGVYPTLTRLSGRPMAIAEMGVVEYAPGVKARWITDAFAALRSKRYPRVRAATWWSMDSGPNTRIDTSPSALAAFRAAVAGPYFDAKLRFSGDCRPPVPTAVKATDGRYARKVRVLWQPVVSASSYEIWRNGSLLGTTRGSFYDDVSAGPARRYAYRVRAVSAGGESPLSVPAVGSRTG